MGRVAEKPENLGRLPRVRVNRIALQTFADLLNVSRTQLAEAACTDRGNLSRAMDGKAPLNPAHLPAFAECLGIPVAALVGPPEETITALIEGRS